MRRTKSTAKRRQTESQLNKRNQTLPFIEHVYELRRRLFYVATSVLLFSLIAYGFEHLIVSALLRPAKNQEFIYTSPGGGLDFLFRVCLYVGVACSIPVIVYQLLRYVEPLLRFTTRKAILLGSIASGILATIGMAFGYFVGLPAALHFLLHQTVTKQIQPLLTIQSYIAFVTVYILGSALLLQVPLILLIINRIKPLKPSKLLSFNVERWVIVGAFVGGGLMNPNPNPIAQLVVVVPVILAYQIGVAIIWFSNRKNQKPAYIYDLLSQDVTKQAMRLQTAKEAKPVSIQLQADQNTINQVAKDTLPKQVATIAAVRASTPSQTARPMPNRPRRYVNDFIPRPTSYRNPSAFPTAENSAT